MERLNFINPSKITTDEKIKLRKIAIIKCKDYIRLCTNKKLINKSLEKILELKKEINKLKLNKKRELTKKRMALRKIKRH